MKRGVVFFGLLVSLLIISVSFSAARVEISGGVIEITGDISKPTNVTVEIVGSPPNVTIIEPLPQTYLTNVSLPLKYIATNTLNEFYNLDNSVNISLTGNTTFNTSEGQHILFLYGEYLNEIAVDNVTFIVNLSLLTILYEEFKGVTAGSSTDYYTFTFEQLQELSDLTLENTTNGKIVLREVVNVTDDFLPNDNFVDFDNAVEIGENSIFVNITEMPNLNTNASLSFYNVNFSQPKILYNGADCPINFCTNDLFIGGIVSFDVPSLGLFQIIEGAVPGPVPGPGGGGGKKNFVMSPISFNIELEQGEGLRDILQLHNNGKGEITISLSQEGLDDFLSFPEGTEFILAQQEVIQVVIDFSAASDYPLGGYVGKIIGEGDGIIRISKVIVIVKSPPVKFDIDVDIPLEYISVSPGIIIPGEITIDALDAGGYNGVINYYVKDLNDNIVFQDSENIIIEDQTYIKEFSAPLEGGTYVFYAVLESGGTIAIDASSFFDVILPAPPLPFNLWWLLLLLILIWLVMRKKSEWMSALEIAIGEKVNSGKKVLTNLMMFQRKRHRR